MVTAFNVYGILHFQIFPGQYVYWLVIIFLEKVAGDQKVGDPEALFFCHCEDAICRLPNGTKFNPFYLREMRRDGIRKQNIEPCNTGNIARSISPSCSTCSVNSSKMPNCHRCHETEINEKTERGESFAQRRDGKIHQKFGPQNIAYHHINSKSNLKVSLYVRKAQWKRVIKVS